jgi:hypothetical protein
MNKRTTTLQYGNVTIIIHRPELTESERVKRERQVQGALSGVMREYYKRKESNNGR